jgi:hypothetical protein
VNGPLPPHIAPRCRSPYRLLWQPPVIFAAMLLTAGSALGFAWALYPLWPGLSLALLCLGAAIESAIVAREIYVRRKETTAWFEEGQRW